MSLNQVLTSFQVLLILGPIAAFWITKRTALSLQRKDREIVLHGRETGRIVRMPHGEYIEVHEPLDKYEMYKLVEYKSYQPTLARPNSQGKITLKARMRASLSKFYFQDRVVPVGQLELDAANHSHAPAVEEAPKPAATKTTAAKKTATKKPTVKKTTVKKPAAKKPEAKTAKKASPKKK
jgi:ubiquinol-cytochrome c reductase cytochrome b subunit